LFEVVGLTGAVHLGQVQTGMAKPIIIGRGNEIKITFNQPDIAIPVQVDGEPWDQQSCVLHITHHNKVKMLFNTEDCHSIVKKEIDKSNRDDDVYI